MAVVQTRICDNCGDDDFVADRSSWTNEDDVSSDEEQVDFCKECVKQALMRAYPATFPVIVQVNRKKGKR